MLILYVFLISLLFLTPFPNVWKAKLQDDRTKFLFFQIIRFIIGVIYSWSTFYLGLLDHTFFAIFSHYALIIALLWMLDFILSKIKGKIGSFFFLGMLLVVLSWLYMTLIYPLTITKDLYGMVKATVSSQKAEEMNIEHIPTVPLEFAKYKGDKLIGNIPNFSYYVIGNYTIQKINNELFWVAPVEFNGFFAWFKGKTTPGYIKISAEDENKPAELIKNANMKYTPSAFFSDNLMRHVRTNYPSLILMEANFEPDDSGKSLYVVTYGHYLEYRNGKVVDGAIVVDPQTGEMKKYTINELPAFIDRIIPQDVASQYNEYFGKYEKGIINLWTAKTGVHYPTTWGTGEEVVGVFNSKKTLDWFTDHTKDQTSTSMVGYSMMNARTGQFTYYTSVNGFLNGNSALQAVEKTYKKQEWTGTQPILYNFYGRDAWFIPVIDGNGLLREFAIVDTQTGNVTTGQTKKAVFENFKSDIVTKLNQNEAVPTNVALVKKISGEVLRINGTQTNVRFLLKNSDKIFVVNSDKFPYVAFLKEGDSVEVSYVDNAETSVIVEQLKNVTLNK